MSADSLDGKLMQTVTTAVILTNSKDKKVLHYPERSPFC